MFKLHPKVCVLSPTASYAKRIAIYVERRIPEPDSLGILLIDHAGKFRVDWYAVEEIKRVAAPGARRFSLAGAHGEHFVEIGPHSQCSCPAGQKSVYGRACKHKDAMAAIVAMPLFPETEPELFDEFSPAVGERQYEVTPGEIPF